MTTDSVLLALHDQQVRGGIAARLPNSWKPLRDGPVLQIATPARGLAFGRDLDGLSVGELDALIGRVRDRSAALGQPIEWKTYGHDRHDLLERLRLAGFMPEDQETIVIGRATDLIAAGECPAGIGIRATTDLADLRRIAALQSEVWGVSAGRSLEGQQPHPATARHAPGRHHHAMGVEPEQDHASGIVSGRFAHRFPGAGADASAQTSEASLA